jgi:hypothetical protein
VIHPLSPDQFSHRIRKHFQVKKEGSGLNLRDAMPTESGSFGNIIGHLDPGANVKVVSIALGILNLFGRWWSIRINQLFCGPQNARACVM